MATNQSQSCSNNAVRKPSTCLAQYVLECRPYLDVTRKRVVITVLLLSLYVTINSLLFSVDIVLVCSRLAHLVVPLFAVFSGYLLLTLTFREWTTNGIYLVVCGCAAGDFIGLHLVLKAARSSADNVATPDESTNLFHPAVLGIQLVVTLYFSYLAELPSNHGPWILLVLACLRHIGCLCLWPVPENVRPFITYFVGLLGVICAKYFEKRLQLLFLSEDRMAVVGSSCIPSEEVEEEDAPTTNHRRRTSSSTVMSQTSPQEVRRTSLPAISAFTKTGHGTACPHVADAALIAEAHGLVTDMLLESSQLPSNIVSGLKALASLLSPPEPRPVHIITQALTAKSRYAQGPVVTVGEVHSSDSEEIMGEKLSALPKRSKRGVPPGLLRRMSTSTWTTTTSATGMPTIEAEPSRKRATNFRTPTQDGPPTFSSSPQHSSVCLAAAVEHGFQYHSQNPQSYQCQSNPSAHMAHKNRSFSTTALFGQHCSAVKRLMKERKTVCSLHPLTSSDISHLEVLAGGRESPRTASSHSDRSHSIEQEEESQQLSAGSSRRGSGSHRRGSSSRKGSGVSAAELWVVNDDRADDETSETKCSNFCCGRSQSGSPQTEMPNGVLPTIRLPLPKRAGKPRTSDYESSDSPGSSDHGEEEVECCPSSPPYVQLPVSRVEEDSEGDCSTREPQPTEVLGYDSSDESSTRTSRVLTTCDGSAIYDLDAMDSDPLLCSLQMWDFPIFSLLEKAGDLVLSTVCYRIFVEVGLFETFKIPVQEFFNFFHALEMGYREKPYHNRTHSADVLHAVYYFTSQPIPGFQVLPPDTETSNKTGSNGSPGLHQRQSFSFEDTYGIMGANLPALELMALYTAAAMHDYDHPGRTNAFLVSTFAHQAILYNDRSVLESHHAAAAWSLFLSSPAFNFLQHLEKAEFKRFRFLVIEAILATDLKRHFEILAEFNAKANDDDAPGIDWTQETDRLLAMQVCIKLADINGPCKKRSIHVQWTYRIAEEFYEQGDEEMALGLPISPYMDRRHPQLARLQESFINHLVAPLCNAYAAAGMLPGAWDDTPDDPSADGNQTGENATSSAFSSGAATPTASTARGSPAGRKIFCLQSKHLADNHARWVAVIRDEQRREEEANALKAESEPSVPLDQSELKVDEQSQTEVFTSEERGPSPQPSMEPIKEESPTNYQSSFSFEAEDSKL